MKKIICLLALFYCTTAFAQYDNYYNSRQYQTNQYRSLSAATTRAYSIPDRVYTPTPSATSPSSSSGSSSAGFNNSGSTNSAPLNSGNNGYANMGAQNRVNMQDEAKQRNEARYKANMAALAEGEQQYRQLIAGHGNAKNDKDHYDLLLRGMRAGIDLNAIFGVIGRNYEAYKAKFGVDPATPYKSSAAIEREEYQAAFSSELTKMLAAEKDNHARMVYLQALVTVKPTFENYLALGQVSLINYDYNEAKSSLWVATSKDSTHFAALVGYGDAQLMLGEAAAAEKTYKKALSINGANADLLLKSAWAASLQNKQDDAYTLARAAAIMLPDNAGPFLVLAALQPPGAERESLLINANQVQPEIQKGAVGEMLFSYAKHLQQNNAFNISLFYLDLAVAANPAAIDYVELRYGTNKKLKREKQAAIDEQLMEKL